MFFPTRINISLRGILIYLLESNQWYADTKDYMHVNGKHFENILPKRTNTKEILSIYDSVGLKCLCLQEKKKRPTKAAKE